MELLYQLQHCLAAAVPQQQPGQLLSHQLEGLNADTPSEPTTPIGTPLPLCGSCSMGMLLSPCLQHISHSSMPHRVFHLKHIIGGAHLYCI
jgi:hypothetical protein